MMRLSCATASLIVGLSSCLVFISPLLAISAEETVAIQSGFLTGEAYLNSSDSRQRAYAMGLVDGLFISPLFGAPKAEVRPYEKCVVGMSDRQVAAILTKYLREHPGRWHESAHVAFFAALKGTCPGT